MRVEEVSKKFCRDLKKSLWYGVKDVSAEILSFGNQQPISQNTDTLRPGEFWANKDITFELRRGDCLGLIGRNGAGKTTLLKMLNGLIKPDHGKIEMRGRIGALIALGAGFNPILSGRENIYVNGSILGLTKSEIDAKIDEIINFAEIEEFIDSPVQSYSSGMQVRLGFAVATAMEPDVLILDEVLAVGDAAFRAKCYNRVISLRKRAAVIFVTHSMEQVARICDSSLLLSKGQIRFHGDASTGIQEYDRVNELGEEQDGSFLSCGEAITNFKISELPHEIFSGLPAVLKIIIGTKEYLENFRLRISFYSPSGEIVAEVNQKSTDYRINLEKGINHLLLEIAVIPLRAGKYRLGLNLIDRHGDLIVWSYKEYALHVIGGDFAANTDCQLPVSQWSKVI